MNESLARNASVIAAPLLMRAVGGLGDRIEGISEQTLEQIATLAVKLAKAIADAARP